MLVNHKPSLSRRRARPYTSPGTVFSILNDISSSPHLPTSCATLLQGRHNYFDTAEPVVRRLPLDMSNDMKPPRTQPQQKPSR
jgi:hypothetical protein